MEQSSHQRRDLAIWLFQGQPSATRTTTRPFSKKIFPKLKIHP